MYSFRHFLKNYLANGDLLNLKCFNFVTNSVVAFRNCDIEATLTSFKAGFKSLEKYTTFIHALPFYKSIK